MKSLADFDLIYQELAVALKKQKWFKSHWEAKAGLFPNATEPKSVAIQVYKDTWFNSDGRGIHFESWMTNADIKRGTSNVVLHIESSKDRTGINGKVLVKTLFDTAGTKITKWEGYETKPTYTMQPFIKKLAITPGNLLKSLLAEFNRLEEISAAIDHAIIESKK